MRHGMIENVIAWLRQNKQRGLLARSEHEWRLLRMRYPDVSAQIYFQDTIRGIEFDALYIDEAKEAA